MNDWYLNIEQGIRKIVHDLRNNGINTTCSCEHEMYIEFDTHDPTEDLKNICTVLISLGIKNYTCEIRDLIDDGHHYTRGEIKIKMI
jgi:hypothetical protein